MKNFLKDKRVALVTDWLTNLGGAEKVLESVSEIFPNAPIFTTIAKFDNIGNFTNKMFIVSVIHRVLVIFNQNFTVNRTIYQ